jgi:hypothetical protein
MSKSQLVVLNAGTARFECTFGRGCDGICCQRVQPPLTPEDSLQIDSLFPGILPLLRAEARKAIERIGYRTRRLKFGQPILRMVGGWCVFFNEGCVLHKIGEARGSRFAYKPVVCAIFPLFRRNANWHIRQKGYSGDNWDLPCLEPTPETPLAVETMQEEFALAARAR